MALTLAEFGIDRLTPEQRLELIDLLWDSIPEDVSYSPPDWHIRELERRIADADANPDHVETWKQVVDRLSRNP